MISGEQVYLPELDQGQEHISITDREYHHLIKVRRFVVGDAIWAVNGKGLAAFCRIEAISNDSAELGISKIESHRGELPRHLTLAIANLKGDHLDLVVEKATELGVHEIIPLMTDRTIKKGLKQERLKRIAVSAMKQSRRSRLPAIHPLTSFQEMVSSRQDAYHLFCHADESSVELTVNKELKKQRNLTVLIGPEGDWSKDEIDLASNSDYTFTGLGPRRLRAETAAIHAVGLLSALLQDPA
ncbi:MAG: 16S rRNA (uracil(1498)-N(3))-methyltransferase [Candidatus Marinimicrobia bacterium]|nr:16S rRNA (uracil(1498)-N(3))-methyltransferase [Candidatus Neomarinimicrobiota bacterium]MCF7850547.1 16S rRNA (uracil(1498)-N(3))-methyltransferase [Candidatus Neomarinimicrobiota bacterium]MCF7904121.1 16S rRNA (uracil(1498)-N(3))-methyltransferase [Candidatus Neomarinimicrobiota bacterium]